MKKPHFFKTVSIVGSLLIFLVCLGLCFWLNLPTTDAPAQALRPNWAPDAHYIVYECYIDGPIKEGVSLLRELGEYEGWGHAEYSDDAADICVVDVREQNITRLTEDPGGDWQPLWSPDGSEIAYLRKDGIYLITLDGDKNRQLVPLHNIHTQLGWATHEEINLTWSPAGDSLLFSGCIENPDNDVYTVDAQTGALTNLTPNSRRHDIVPKWTLDGAKIVYLSTDASLSYTGSCAIENDAPHQLKAVDVDGGNEKILYNEEIYITDVSVTNSGEVFFVSDLVSKTVDDLDDGKHASLYRIRVDETIPVEVPNTWIANSWSAPLWSPDEENLAYYVSGRINILNVSTEETRNLPAINNASIEDIYWSPDGQHIAAVVVHYNPSGIPMERQIFIFEKDTLAVSAMPQK